MTRRRQRNSTLRVAREPMKRGAGFKARSTPLRAKPIKAKKKPKKKSMAQRRRDALRKEAEFARTYHSEERVLFVKFANRCEVPHCLGRPENAHLETEGTSRKAHYTRIAPLCGGHHRNFAKSLHRMGSVEAFDAVAATNLNVAAARLEERWQTEGPAWIAQAQADGSYESMRRPA